MKSVSVNVRSARSILSLGGSVLCLAGFLACFAGTAHAANGGDPSGWVGAEGGLTVPNYTNTTARPDMGITAGAKLGSEYGIGAYYHTSTKSESANGSTFNFGYDLYGVMAGYFFEGDAKGVFLGAMLGMAKVSNQATVSGVTYNLSTSPVHYGLAAGFDKMLGSMFSIGGEVSYVSIAGSSTNYTPTGSAAAVTANLDPFSILNAMITLKFWF